MKPKTTVPLPPVYKDGRRWTVATLKSLSGEELRSLIRRHGASALNAALARNKENK